jgi:hypothetical protein
MIKLSIPIPHQSDVCFRNVPDGDRQLTIFKHCVATPACVLLDWLTAVLESSRQPVLDALPIPAQCSGELTRTLSYESDPMECLVVPT